ncbi:MAG: J domain-containing protein [Chloroflexota bacterium]
MRYTGKTLQDMVRESAQRPRELPSGERTAIAEAEPGMPLDWAYSVLGLKPDASLDDVKRNYRNLARLFHSDKGTAMNDEAMKLINRAYERISKGRK